MVVEVHEAYRIVQSLALKQEIVCWIIPYGTYEDHALKNVSLKEAGLAKKNIANLLKHVLSVSAFIFLKK